MYVTKAEWIQVCVITVQIDVLWPVVRRALGVSVIETLDIVERWTEQFKQCDSCKVRMAEYWLTSKAPNVLFPLKKV